VILTSGKNKRNEYLLSAENEDEREAWIEALRIAAMLTFFLSFF